MAGAASQPGQGEFGQGYWAEQVRFEDVPEIGHWLELEGFELRDVGVVYQRVEPPAPGEDVGHLARQASRVGEIELMYVDRSRFECEILGRLDVADRRQHAPAPVRERAHTSSADAGPGTGNECGL
jgi:hypothetical protein